MEKNRTDPGLHRWFIPAIRPGLAVDSTLITFGEVFSIFFMQHWGKLQAISKKPIASASIWYKNPFFEMACRIL
jgi:hypothetical protein